MTIQEIRKKNVENLKELGFGVEIEMNGTYNNVPNLTHSNAREITCGYVAKLMSDAEHNVVNSIHYDGGYYDIWTLRDVKNRKWQFMTDGSSSGDLGCIDVEMVTPILNYDDIELLQEVVRHLRGLGYVSNVHFNSGVHIHITDGGYTANDYRKLMNVTASHEHLIKKACAVTLSREHWCKYASQEVLIKLNNTNNLDMNKFWSIWYSRANGSADGPNTEHYDSSRYHLLNLHSSHCGKGIEFRCFEFKKNMHAGMLKSWIQLCLSIVSYSKLLERTNYKEKEHTNEKLDMRSWLINMGLNSDEFRTCRKILTKRLSGDSAYANGRPNVDTTDDNNISID